MIPSRDAMDEGEQKPDFIDFKQERESALWRLKRASDRLRENRVKRLLAQEGESIWLTLGRPAFLSGCILFDGPVLMEIIRFGDREAWSWFAYLIILFGVVKIQRRIYEQFFSVDISSSGHGFR